MAVLCPNLVQGTPECAQKMKTGLREIDSLVSLDREKRKMGMCKGAKETVTARSNICEISLDGFRNQPRVDSLLTPQKKLW